MALIPMFWHYEKEHGGLYAKCPCCQNRMPMGRGYESNPYHYCPYCGQKLLEGWFKRVRKEVYGRDV